MTNNIRQAAEIDPFVLRMIVEEAAVIGALSALVQSGSLSPYLKKSEAYVRYGRYKTEQWIEKGYLSIRKDGNYSAAWRIDRVELEILACAARLAPYISAGS
jgi:hypothetical protein